MAGKEYSVWAESLVKHLNLRWSPVAVKLFRAGEELPVGVKEPSVPLRHCQSIVTARKGKTFLMPVKKHACPDGGSVLGLMDLPPKLKDGRMYLTFQKVNNAATAEKMVAARPHLEAQSSLATMVGPLADDFPAVADVVAVSVNPEQAMWILCAASFFSGERHNLNLSGFNAICVDVTLLPYQTGKLNLSFACYGCRAVSDFADDELMVGIPIKLLPEIVQGIEALSKKAIPEARNKIYMPPFV